VNELSFHSLRHTLTSDLKNAGVSEVIAMDWVGHDSRAISRVYTHISSSAKRDALKQLPNVV
jgi:integrase